MWSVVPPRRPRLNLPLLLGALLLAVATVLAGQVGRTYSSPGSSPGVLSYLPNPQNRMLLGAYTALAGADGDSEASTGYRENELGRRYDLELTYYNWTDPFPDFGEATIAAHGRTPVMTWYGPGKSPGSHYALTEITNGSQDKQILDQAQAIRKFGRPIFLRPLIEMNGNWYPGYSGHPAAYIAAWQRIHNLFARAGADNVIWVWCPNITPHDWDEYYPGNSYVDVIGVDGYNNTDAGGPWRSFAQIFSPFLKHYAGRKPLMIGETATSAGSGGAAAYINGMHSYLKDVAGPRYGVIAVCWFDTNISDGGYDWRVSQTDAGLRAWVSLARDPYFGGPGARQPAPYRDGVLGPEWASKP